ncbi:MAG: glycosyl hydrolase-related protein, partial [Armatimonadota bacterium]|nr:glycosyl hydrolase-related protein [Armatimonadota bacterium]
ENNLPNGECFIRNQQMGLQWVRETWGAEVRTGWLVDTFGVNAQVPQLLRGFGMTQLMANRFGGSHTHDLFRARGLDGSEITVAGWGSYAAYMKPENLSERFCANWDDIAACFAKADHLGGPGPFMVIPYTENEMPVSRRPQQLIEERNRERDGQHWQMATPREYFAAVENSGRDLPVVDGDLNPEFTGCFSLRQPIRLRHRRVETHLLEAEKWAALAGFNAPHLAEAWWQLHFVQFHDVFTGSHPTAVFHEVMRLLDEIEAAADKVLKQAFAQLAPSSQSEGKQSEGEMVFVAFNGLPWTRRDGLEMPLPPGFAGVSRVAGANNEAWPFEVQGGVVRIGAEVPAVGFQSFSLQRGSAREAIWHEVESATLENEWIRCDFDGESGLAKLIWKPTGAVLLENAGSWLVAQRDDGNFQIENPSGAEVSACSGSLRLERLEASPLGQTVRLSGEFPPLSWADDGSFLRWNVVFFLPANRAEVRLKLGLDWKGEASRARLTLPTQIDTALGIYEIPFGVVARKPYSPRANTKGEWPAHRFVALESDGHGIALANTGVAGVEVNGGTLYTTLLRAPASVYAGMVRDETSSQHGHHEYQFSILPYAGSWIDAEVARYAQELNSPILSDLRAGTAQQTVSLFQLEPANVVLSSIKAAEDGSGHLIVRVYETAGQATDAVLTMPAARQIWSCDLQENSAEEIAAPKGELRFALKPFEIKSFRVRRDA